MHEATKEEMVEGTSKRKRDKVSRGQRKRQKEENIRADETEHSPVPGRHDRRPESFHSED